MRAVMGLFLDRLVAKRHSSRDADRLVGAAEFEPATCSTQIRFHTFPYFSQLAVCFSFSLLNRLSTSSGVSASFLGLSLAVATIEARGNVLGAIRRTQQIRSRRSRSTRQALHRPMTSSSKDSACASCRAEPRAGSSSRPGAGGRRVAKRTLALGQRHFSRPSRLAGRPRPSRSRARLGDDPAARRPSERGTPYLSAVIRDYLTDVEASLTPGTARIYRRKITSIDNSDYRKLHRR